METIADLTKSFFPNYQQEKKDNLEKIYQTLLEFRGIKLMPEFEKIPTLIDKIIKNSLYISSNSLIGRKLNIVIACHQNIYRFAKVLQNPENKNNPDKQMQNELEKINDHLISNISDANTATINAIKIIKSEIETTTVLSYRLFLLFFIIALITLILCIKEGVNLHIVPSYNIYFSIFNV